MRTIFELKWGNKGTKHWIKENVSFEPCQITHRVLFRFWRFVLQVSRGILLEHRYVSDILEGLTDDGFEPGRDFELTAC